MSKHILTSDKDEKIRTILEKPGITSDQFGQIKTEIIEITKNSIEKLIVSEDSGRQATKDDDSEAILEDGFIDAAKEYYKLVFSGETPASATGTSSKIIKLSDDRKSITNNTDFKGLIIGVINKNDNKIIASPFPKYNKSSNDWDPIPTHFVNYIINQSENKDLAKVKALYPNSGDIDQIVIVTFEHDVDEYLKNIQEYIADGKNGGQKAVMEKIMTSSLEAWSIAAGNFSDNDYFTNTINQNNIAVVENYDDDWWQAVGAEALPPEIQKINMFNSILLTMLKNPNTSTTIEKIANNSALPSGEEIKKVCPISNIYSIGVS